jgi:hypothetical protein
MNENTALLHHVLDVAQALRVGHVPAHTGQHHFKWVVKAFEDPVQGAVDQALAEIEHDKDCRLCLLRQNLKMSASSQPDAPHIISRMKQHPFNQTSQPRSAEILRILSQEMASGKLVPGTQLKEELLCQRFGASRTPISDALKQLAAQGLVELKPQKWLGLFKQLSPNDKWSPGGLQQCRVVHGGARRLRRTGRRGGQLGAHQ